MIASKRSLTIFLVINAVLFAQGALMQAASAGKHAAGPPAHPNMAPFYVVLILLELLFFRLVWKSVNEEHPGRFWEVVACRWRLGRAALVDVLLGVCLCVAWQGIILLAVRLFASGHGASPVNPFLPQSPLEICLWFVLAGAAGFSEEIAYRGYLQKQFEGLVGNRAGALGLQAAVFALAHSYQGFASVGLIFCFALLFGAVALWRGDLKAGILGHALSDMYVGYLQRLF